MENNFVERRSAGFYLAGSRVPIDCIVHEYGNGEPEESIRAHYPALSLEHVHGAIAFYLANRDEVDAANRPTRAGRGDISCLASATAGAEGETRSGTPRSAREVKGVVIRFLEAMRV